MMMASKVRGFSLLEMLLVLALMVLMTTLAVPYWQSQQYPVKRQLAWLQLQQLLLAQAEYHMQSGAYAMQIESLAHTDALPAGYDYGVEQRDDGMWLVAQVRQQGPQSGDEACWQLQLHESGRQSAVDKQGRQSLVCE